MIRQQPEGHDTFASGDSCFCVAKVAPVALSIITDSVNWLSDKRYLCVRINHQIGPLSRTEQKSLWPQAVFRETLTFRIIFTSLGREIARQIRICRAMIIWDVYTGIFLYNFVDKQSGFLYNHCLWVRVMTRKVNGRLAQLGERLPYKQNVSGSIPLAPTIKLRRFFLR